MLEFCKEEVQRVKWVALGKTVRQPSCFFNKLLILITVRLGEGIFQALFRRQFRFY
jgi:hypothetical protein